MRSLRDTLLLCNRVPRLRDLPVERSDRNTKSFRDAFCRALRYGEEGSSLTFCGFVELSFCAAHPALSTRCGEAGRSTFANDAALELRQRTTDMEEQPAAGRRRVHCLVEDEMRRLPIGRVAHDPDVLRVDVGRAGGKVHAELRDVVRGLLAAETVLIAAQEAAVVVQPDGAKRLVLRELVAVGDLYRPAAIVVALLLCEFVDASHRGTLPTVYTLRGCQGVHNMFEAMKLKRELAKLDAWDEADSKAFKERCDAAKKYGKPLPDEGERASFFFMIEDQKNQLISKDLLRQANEYGVPAPSLDNKDAWEDRMGMHFLSVNGVAKLRSVIRREINERWDLRIKILGIVVPAVVGILGALIGLVAVWKK